jgi:uncharacterized membrane protein YraQ (UPF0718 family)
MSHLFLSRNIEDGNAWTGTSAQQRLHDTSAAVQSVRVPPCRCGAVPLGARRYHSCCTRG